MGAAGCEGEVVKMEEQGGIVIIEGRGGGGQRNGKKRRRPWGVVHQSSTRSTPSPIIHLPSSIIHSPVIDHQTPWINRLPSLTTHYHPSSTNIAPSPIIHLPPSINPSYITKRLRLLSRCAYFIKLFPTRQSCEFDQLTGSILIFASCVIFRSRVLYEKCRAVLPFEDM